MNRNNKEVILRSLSVPQILFWTASCQVINSLPPKTPTTLPAQTVPRCVEGRQVVPSNTPFVIEENGIVKKLVGFEFQRRKRPSYETGSGPAVPANFEGKRIYLCETSYFEEDRDRAIQFYTEIQP